VSGAARARVALVAGGARGIGREIAIRLVAAGVRVVVADPMTGADGIGADPAAAAARAAEIGALAFAESIASPGAAAQAIGHAERAAGGMDILVNAATIRRDAAIDALDAGDWEAVIRTNLSAATWLVAAACRRWRRDGTPGRIVSIVPHVGGTGRAAVAAASAGLIGLTRAAARDMRLSDIRINAIMPRERGSNHTLVAAHALVLAAREPVPPSGEILREEQLTPS